MKKGSSERIPVKPSGGVISQQGRVPLDGDFGEHTDILRRYILAHPNAEGTADVIRRRWLAPHNAPVKTSVVESALETLIAQGLIVKETHSDGKIRYRRHSAA